MGEFKSYRKESRTDWGSYEKGITLEQVNTGSLLRIADATELMAKNHEQLVQLKEYYERRYNEERQRADKLERQVRGYKGVISRMKKQR